MSESKEGTPVVRIDKNLSIVFYKKCLIQNLIHHLLVVVAKENKKLAVVINGCMQKIIINIF